MEYNDFLISTNDEIIKMAKEYHSKLNNSNIVENKTHLESAKRVLEKTLRFTQNSKISKLKQIITNLEHFVENNTSQDTKVNNFCEGIKSAIFHILEYIKQWSNLDFAESENTKTFQELIGIVQELINLLGECRYRK